MRWLRSHPGEVTLAAFAIATSAVVAIAGAYGFGAFAHSWSRVQFGWLALAIGGQLLATLAYVLAYRVLARFNGGPRLALPLALRVVIAGFGPSAVGGGFVLDTEALHSLEHHEDSATVRVLGLGALEWALLAPAAWLSAVVLLVLDDRRPMASLLWPWAVAVPIGFALGLWLATPRCRHRISSGGGNGRAVLSKMLSGVGMLLSLARAFPSYWAAWVGTSLYWALDIASFYACLRFIGLHATLGESILAYATGYALTRRSMPLGGAGITEAMMTFALHWVGEPLAPALAAVVVYRLLNFVLPAYPALLVSERVYPLLRAGGDRRAADPSDRRHAAAPLHQL